ncbi:hypothetical protein IU429_15150 [Nocardia elegans]|nr:hypothetical protein [Nocardia elegans]
MFGRVPSASLITVKSTENLVRGARPSGSHSLAIGPANAASTLDPLSRRAVMAALLDVPDLLVELETTMSRTDAVAPRAMGGRTPMASREPMLPFHTGAADARAALTSALARLSRQVAAVVGHPAPGDASRQASYLSAHVPELQANSPALAGATDITAAVRAARIMIDHPQRQQQRVLGACVCGAALYAGEEQVTVHCVRCQRTHSATAVRTAAVGRASDKLATAAQLARLLPWISDTRITADRIRQWAARGKLPVHHIDGRALYRVGDVLAIATGRQ